MKRSFYKVVNLLFFMSDQNDNGSLTFREFRRRYHFCGREGVLRITAKITGAYDAANNTYKPLPDFLAILAKEGRLNDTLVVTPSQESLPPDIAYQRELPLDQLIKRVLHTCTQDHSLRNIDQPCRGDVEAFLLRETLSSPLRETYSRSLLPKFFAYWKKSHQ